MLGLHREIGRVRAGKLLGRDVDVVVAVHVRRHGLPLDRRSVRARLASRFIGHLDEFRAANFAMGVAGARSRGLSRLRPRRPRGRPHPAEPRRRVRPALARRPDRPRRRAPPVPHRHRHHLAGAARRSRHRRRFLTERAGSRARPRRGAPESRSGSSSRSCTPRPRCSPEQFDLVYTGVGALNWLPDIAAGRRSSPRCCGRAGGSTSATQHPMLMTLSTTAIDDHELRVTLPYFEGHAAALVQRGDLHRRRPDRVARAVRVEPRSGRDRPGGDRRRPR